MVDTLGRIYRTAKTSAAQQKSCFGEWTGRLSFPQAWVRLQSLFERYTGLAIDNEAIIGISTPQLIVMGDYTMPPFAERSKQAFDMRDDKPVTVWTQVILVDAVLVECDKSQKLLESAHSVKPIFPGEWGKFRVAGKAMRDGQIDLEEQRRALANNRVYRPTLHCRQDLVMLTENEPEYWKRFQIFFHDFFGGRTVKTTPSSKGAKVFTSSSSASPPSVII